MHETEPKDVERTLARLGVEELEERLELTPLLAAGGDGAAGADACCNLCTCKIVPLEPMQPIVRP